MQHFKKQNQSEIISLIFSISNIIFSESENVGRWPCELPAYVDGYGEWSETW